MKITFNFKNFDPSDHLRKYAKERFGKLGKFMAGTDDAELQVNLEVEKFRHIADIVLTGKNVHISAREDSEDMYSTVDLVWDKLEAQMRKLRDKAKSQRKGGNDTVRMDIIRIDEDQSGVRRPNIHRPTTTSPSPWSWKKRPCSSVPPAMTSWYSSTPKANASTSSTAEKTGISA
jgi:putative sigma-54 modulation protein